MVEVLNRPPARRLLIALVTLLLIVGVVAAVEHRDGGIDGDARLRTDGVATVTRAGVAPRSVKGTFPLLRGDVVEAVEGSLTIDLQGGAQLEGRVGSGDNAATKLVVAAPGQATELVVGELLVTAAHGAEVMSAGNEFRLDSGVDGASAARLSRSLAVGAGVYRGSGTLDSAGQREGVAALRQAEVAAVGRAPSAPKPLRLHGEDPWDRRFLGAAIDLGQRLDALSSQYTKTLRRTDARTVGFYRSLLPALAAETAFTQSLLDTAADREQGEILVGSAIAALGRRDSFADRWTNVFEFRDEGASWGLIALDQGVSEDPLLADLDKAVTGTGFEFALPPGANRTTTPRTTPTTVPSGPTVTAPSSPTTTPASPSPSPTTQPPPEPPPLIPPLVPPTVPPPTVPAVPPTGVAPVDNLTDTVNQIVGGLLGQPPPP